VLADIVREDFAQLSRMRSGAWPKAICARRSFPTARRWTMPAATRSRTSRIPMNALVAGLNQIGSELTTGLRKLRELISGVASASARLSESSAEATTCVKASSDAVDHIAEPIERIANGAQSQAGRIDDTSAPIEELTHTADQIALRQLDDGIESLSAHGGVLTESAREASSEAAIGNVAVSQTQFALRRLREVSQTAAEAMTTARRTLDAGRGDPRLHRRDRRPDDLLALNAAIEAACAGDQGRGLPSPTKSANSPNAARARQGRFRRSCRRSTAKRSAQQVGCGPRATRWKTASTSPETRHNRWPA
jgi:hypothetical protein